MTTALTRRIAPLATAAVAAAALLTAASAASQAGVTYYSGSYTTVKHLCNETGGTVVKAGDRYGCESKVQRKYRRTIDPQRPTSTFYLVRPGANPEGGGGHGGRGGGGGQGGRK